MAHLEIKLHGTRWFLWLAGAINLLLFQWFEWPAGGDYLIPRSPYGKIDPVGRGGDLIFLSAMVFILAGAYLVGRVTVRGSLIALCIAGAMGAAVASMIVILKLQEPDVYRSIPLTLIAAKSFSVVVVCSYALLKIHRLVESPPIAENS